MPFKPGTPKPVGSGRRKKTETPRLEIVYKPIGWFKPYERNPRKNDSAVEKIRASIREYGFTVPMLARSTGEVIDGHLRLKGATAEHKADPKTLQEIPTILCDNWTPAQVKAFRLMVNRSVTWADWDLDALRLEFDDLKALDFDLSKTGFESFETNWSAPTGAGGAAVWAGMPGFQQADQLPWKSVQVHFKNAKDRDAFAKLVDQLITDKTKYLWYPEQERPSHLGVRWASTGDTTPRYPVYVISKGRHESRLTAKALDLIGVPYHEDDDYGMALVRLADLHGESSSMVLSADSDASGDGGSAPAGSSSAAMHDRAGVAK